MNFFGEFLREHFFCAICKQLLFLCNLLIRGFIIVVFFPLILEQYPIGLVINLFVDRSKEMSNKIFTF